MPVLRVLRFTICSSAHIYDMTVAHLSGPVPAGPGDNCDRTHDQRCKNS